MRKKLYRSSTDKVFGGVCAGLADFFGMDATLVRIIFVLMFLIYGIGPVLYIILWIIAPVEPIASETTIDVQPQPIDDES